MSIIIHGVNMPKDCLNCQYSRYNIDGTMTCKFINEYIRDETKRLEECPIEEYEEETQ